MIWHPRIGQQVVIRYRKAWKALMPWEGGEGVVVCVARGPGPINAMIETERGRVVVPRGNLVAKEASDADKA